MAEYILKLNGKYIPSWWKAGDPKAFRVVDGEHELAYDLVMNDLPCELVERMYDCLFSSKSKREQKCHGDSALSLPIGVSKATILAYGIGIIPLHE